MRSNLSPTIWCSTGIAKELCMQPKPVKLPLAEEVTGFHGLAVTGGAVVVDQHSPGRADESRRHKRLLSRWASRPGVGWMRGGTST